MKSVAFHFCPKIHHVFGLLLIETISPRTFKKSPNLFTLNVAPSIWPMLLLNSFIFSSYFLLILSFDLFVFFIPLLILFRQLWLWIKRSIALKIPLCLWSSHLGRQTNRLLPELLLYTIVCGHLQCCSKYLIKLLLFSFFYSRLCDHNFHNN